MWKAKYPAARLEQPLHEIFGERGLAESRVPLVIPTYNIGVNAVCLLKTPHHERLRRDHRLRDSWPGTVGDIYPQGSIRLATMVAPITEDCDYDIDLVCRLWLTNGISKKELKRLVGEALRAFVRSRPQGTVKLEEGKRCWTLAYHGQRFHMDVLPAIPNEEHPLTPSG